MFDDFKLSMVNEFEMTNDGLMSYFLGIHVKQMNNRIFISQERYARETLKKFNMKGCNLVNTPIESEVSLSCYDEADKINSTLYKSLVRRLRYLTCIRSDILHVRETDNNTYVGCKKNITMHQWYSPL